MMNSTYKKAPSWLSALLFCAGPVFAQQVRTDYDRNVDFNQYKSYSWGGVHTQDELWTDRIKSAVDSALEKKGWTRVDSGGDVAVMAMEMTQDHRTLNTYYDNFGGGWRWGGGFGTATTTEDIYKVGTLVVDVFDHRTKMLVWRGACTAVISSKSDKNIKLLDRGVERMFEHFPPETHKTAGDRRFPVMGDGRPVQEASTRPVDEAPELLSVRPAPPAESAGDPDREHRIVR